jgi:esterase/lipase
MATLREETEISRSIWELEREVSRHPENLRLRASLIRAFHMERTILEEHFGVKPEDRSFLHLKEHRSAGCLLLHGSPGSPAEMREIAEFLFKHGFTVYGARLPQHGQKPEDLDRFTWRNTLSEIANTFEVLQNVTRQVYVVGWDFGAILALHLARQYGEVKGLVLLSPPLYPRVPWRERLLFTLRSVLPRLYSRLAGWRGEVLEGLEKARGLPSRVGVPILLIQATEDPALSRRGRRFLKRIGQGSGIQADLLKGSDHRLLEGEKKEEVYQKVLGFIRRA